jgi:hypothetical protein
VTMTRDIGQSRGVGKVGFDLCPHLIAGEVRAEAKFLADHRDRLHRSFLPIQIGIGIDLSHRDVPCIGSVHR